MSEREYRKLSKVLYYYKQTPADFQIWGEPPLYLYKS